MKTQDYVVIGKISEVDFESLLKEKINEKIEKPNVKKAIIKVLITTSAAILTASILEGCGIGNSAYASTLNDSMVVGAAGAYKEPIQLRPVLNFIDWLIYMVRLIVSAVIGLIATYAGYKWSTDISGNGSSEAKKILKNSAIGLFWVHFGATIANFVVDKMKSMV